MSAEVRSMFAAIARRYDRANDVLSFGIHRLWRRQAVRAAGIGPGSAVLDCATGTGDLALAFHRAVRPGGVVVGTDFCAEMLDLAREKARGAGVDLDLRVADAMDLPFPGGRFDAASISFGIRNVDDPRRCLDEMSRVVRPGGTVVVLEFGKPRGPFGRLYGWYGRRLMPLIGGWLTGNRAAYEYLPRTAAVFPAGPRFLSLMEETGRFRSVEGRPLMFGVAWLYRGVVGPRT